MAQCKTVLSPLLMHRKYCSLAVLHWALNIVLNSLQVVIYTKAAMSNMEIFSFWYLNANCSSSIADALDILQSCTKPSILCGEIHSYVLSQKVTICYPLFAQWSSCIILTIGSANERRRYRYIVTSSLTCLAHVAVSRWRLTRQCWHLAILCCTLTPPMSKHVSARAR